MGRMPCSAAISSTSVEANIATERLRMFTKVSWLISAVPIELFCPSNAFEQVPRQRCVRYLPQHGSALRGLIPIALYDYLAQLSHRSDSKSEWRPHTK